MFLGMTVIYTGVVLDAPDAQALAGFYRRLLDWQYEENTPGWVVLRARDGGARLSFQSERLFRRPTWPASDGEQQIQAHLDIEVDDLPAETERAVSLGADVADFQPQEHVRVCLDPVGHPFCLWVRES
jgi:predicted enzyme related to lactoylglutathione lyase